MPPPRRRHRRKPEAHSLLGQYAGAPAGPDTAAAVIDDPYGPPSDAPATGHLGEWTPAPRPRIVVVRSYRHDPLGRMHARHQLTEPEYRAGRAYQELAEAACGSGGRTASFWASMLGGNGKTSGAGQIPITDTMLRAALRMRGVDSHLRRRYGAEGLAVVHGVLMLHRDVGRLGAEDNARFGGMLFRACLGEIAILLGQATKRPRNLA